MCVKTYKINISHLLQFYFTGKVDTAELSRVSYSRIRLISIYIHFYPFCVSFRESWMYPALLFYAKYAFFTLNEFGLKHTSNAFEWKTNEPIRYIRFRVVFQKADYICQFHAAYVGRAWHKFNLFFWHFCEYEMRNLVDRNFKLCST